MHAEALTPVHRLVGSFDKAIDRVATSQLGESYGNRSAIVTDRERTGDGFDSRFGRGHGEALNHAQKLVAAVANRQIVCPELEPKALGHSHDESIARSVPLGIVDYLEMVDVDEGNREGLAGTKGTCHFSFEYEQARSPSVGAGQRVERGVSSIIG